MANLAFARELSTRDLAPLSVEQYHRMLEAGVLEDGAPVELLAGLLVVKDRGGREMTISPRHRFLVLRLLSLTQPLLDRNAHLQIQSPLTLPPGSEPEPDGMIVAGEADRYRDRHPGPGEVSCVIEVADSSLQRDRTVKLRIYAEAAILQYVLVNLVDQQLEIHEEPAAGQYHQRLVLGAADEVGLLLPDGSRLHLPVAAWLV